MPTPTWPGGQIRQRCHADEPEYGLFVLFGVVSPLVWLVATALAPGFAWTGTLALARPLGFDLTPVTAAAAAILGTLHFLLPLASAGGFRPARLVAASGLAAATTLALALSGPSLGIGQAMALGNAAGLALTAGLLVYLLGALAVLLAPLIGSAPAALGWLGLVMALLAASPVWLGSALDRLGAGGAAVDALIAVNPVTHLAVVAQIDYLRGDWLYRHSPLGSMRYGYPTPAAILFGYLIACAAASWIAWRRGGHALPAQPDASPDTFLHVNKAEVL
jgi:hypothetical protein